MNNLYLVEMIKNQNKNGNLDDKLYLSDMKRISENIDNSLFDKDNCSIWNGSKIKKKDNKGYYINFYFNKKKMSLHRILYKNYNNNLKKNEYLKFTCKNKGICCNVNHITKINKNKNYENNIDVIKKVSSNSNLSIEEDKNNKLTIIF